MGWLETLQRLGAEDPLRPALLAPGRPHVSFQALESQVISCAGALRAFGIGQETRVALCVPQGLDAASLLVSVMANAVAVPLNPKLPARELQNTLSRAGVRALILPDVGSEEALRLATDMGLPVLGLRSDPAGATSSFTLEHRGGPAQVLGSYLGGVRTPSSPSLILHTSGSTGEPKRVVLCHQQLAASALNVARHLQLQLQDRSINVMPLFHSHGIVGVLLGSLAAGASVVVMESFEPTAFCEAVAAFQPTWYSASPTIHISVLEHVEVYRSLAAEHRFRLIRSTSSALPEPVLRRLEISFGAPVIESFGMTEWSQMASNPLPPAHRKPGTVGRASGVELALLQGDGQLVPITETLPAALEGELLVRGDGVAKAYDGDEAATAASWWNGWFKTGDVARVDEEGFVRMVGRQKDQINRGGEKISPLEIEAALLSHPAVHDAAAFGMAHPTLGEDLVAAVALKSQGQVSETALREHLFKLLADFKVPSAVVIADAIPRSATGKVRRADLAAHFGSLLVPATAASAAPATAMETALQGIWSEVLRRQGIGLDDNFFALGGDSLSGMRVVGRVNKQLGIRFAPSLLFKHPSVRALAAQLQPPAPPPLSIAMPVTDQDLAAQLAHLSDEEVMRLLAQEEARVAERT